jgi:hypothetical protein
MTCDIFVNRCLWKRELFVVAGYWRLVVRHRRGRGSSVWLATWSLATVVVTLL